MGEPDFFDEYLAYTAATEPPRNYHRWCAISVIASLIGRNLVLPFGHSKLVPNQYIMLIGASGSKKSTAINIGVGLLREFGYETIAAEKTSKEKFLLDLQDGLFADDSPDAENILGSNTTLWNDNTSVRECLVAAGEFNDFIGNGNIDFLSLLGSLWDYSGIYKARVKNSKSVAIPNPTINLLAGNTPDRLASAIPVEAIGQGFTSRLLLIHGEKSDRKFTIPPTPDEADKRRLLDKFQKIQSHCRGVATFESDAMQLLDKVYHEWGALEDSRFSAYSTRRIVHLLKLTVIFAAGHYSTVISKRDVIYANTVLTLAEYFMPRTFGEFGKAKNSSTANKVVEFLLENDDRPRTIGEIFKSISSDLDNIMDLQQIMTNLQQAGKIQQVKGQGFLPKRAVVLGENTDALDWTLVSDEEKGVRK